MISARDRVPGLPTKAGEGAVMRWSLAPAAIIKLHGMSGSRTRGVAELAGDSRVEAARRLIHETDALTLAHLIELAEIPAPPFGEERRAARILELLREAGLAGIHGDGVGNALALYAAADGAGAPLILSAHLDTVFPPDVEMRVRRAGNRLIGPGVSDNARGLAALVAVARVMKDADVRPLRPILFAATVGEEGIGNLRGVRHLFQEGAAARAASGFISLDGTGRRQVVNQGLGSRRLRAAIRGRGGHSWADWGLPNPIHMLGIAVAKIAALRLPHHPRTAVTVARIGGGMSVNAIPAEAWIEVDLRSESPGVLADTECRVRNCLERSIASAVPPPGHGEHGIELSVEVIGERPAAETSPDLPLVRAAQEATRFLGEIPELVSSSTDANIPMALGIPAIAMGAGGSSGNAHTTEEWYSNEGGPEGIERVLLTVLWAVGLRS